MTYEDYLQHHGIKGMKWGDRNGPPYPLTDIQRSGKERNLNKTSRTAKHLTKVGTNSRFNKAAKSSGGGSSSSSSENSSSSSSSERKEGYTYHDTLTRESRMEMLKRTNPDKYNGSGKGTYSSKESSNKKSSSKSSKSKEELEAEERKKWIKDAKSLINSVFSNGISVHSFKDILDEFYNGLFAKNFDGEDDIDLDNLVNDDGNPLKLSEGDKFYVKLMSRLDSKDENYSKWMSKFSDILNDSESSPLQKLSKAISTISYYADYLENNNRSSEHIKAYSQILGHLDSKLKSFMTYAATKAVKVSRTNSYKVSVTSNRATDNKIRVYYDIEEYLMKNGF